MDNFCLCGCGKIINKKCNYVLGHYIRIHNPMTKKKISESLKGRLKSDNHKRKLSASHTGLKQSKETIMKRIEHIKGKQRPEEVKRKISESNTGKKRSEETIQKLSESHAGKCLGEKNHNFGKMQTAKAKKQQSEGMKARWQSSAYVKKQMKSRGVRPNKPELHLQSLLNELYPNDFKYVGDGEVIIAGKCPDFININGKKQIIELYGDYWHRGEKEEDRIKIFEPYGYKTLIIWERELEDINRLKHKIKEFNKASGNGSINVSPTTSSEVKPSGEGEL